MRQLPTKGATTAIKSYTDRKTHIHTHIHTLSQHFHSTAYMKRFRRTVYGSTWMEKHFFNFQQYICAEIVSSIALSGNTLPHTLFLSHTCTYAQVIWTQHVLRATCQDSQHKSDRCLRSLFFPLLCWSNRCSIALSAFPPTSPWKISLHMRRGSTSITRKRDSESEREKKVGWSALCVRFTLVALCKFWSKSFPIFRRAFPLSSPRSFPPLSVSWRRLSILSLFPIRGVTLHSVARGKLSSFFFSLFLIRHSVLSLCLVCHPPTPLLSPRSLLF